MFCTASFRLSSQDMGGGSGSAFGMAMVAMKVTVSCLCSVLADKHMKDDQERDCLQ